MCTALGQPRLLGELAHALGARFTKRLENPQTFLPKSQVGLVLQRVAELSPEFSPSAYLTDTQLSRVKRLPKNTSYTDIQAEAATQVTASNLHFTRQVTVTNGPMSNTKSVSVLVSWQDQSKTHTLHDLEG
jgi:hypothetical protein